MPKMTASDIAIQALKKIERHEKDCGERWAEATTELKYIKKTLNEHGKRWEKTAWVLISTVGVSVIILLLD
tara:strand:- start:10770 stop:10982 length:213 start_codon:yes stop_codon:yes gene_type:complete